MRSLTPPEKGCTMGCKLTGIVASLCSGTLRHTSGNLLALLHNATPGTPQESATKKGHEHNMKTHTHGTYSERAYGT